ncbi:T9SS type A sorting domain-containing protein [Hymenobacter properus]|uniref:T9SS type A sorting domain-containing protein n=1 Tax=Hymenobacter properus TaxID=2791026 RepID=A0A931BI44_9BACT|nr:T9SS type A sorting domain-containing protein [Hymenobacter properus]MBF9141986.1 T9SS type A sorting domain-containing protein [Hymenobacter properus]MBR7720793.1 T9SS type A sorting domain-containing protein [Microvirga sp. SRT04]
MKKSYATLPMLLLASSAWGQPVSSLVPARNAPAANRATVVSATLAAPAPMAALRVFSAQAGGRKAGSSTVSGNAVTFAPAVDFRPGETVTTSLTGASPHVWQFVAAATGGTGTFTTTTSVNTAPGQTSGSTATITPADLDGDGDLDVLVPGGYGSGLLAWYLNDGSGQLTSANRFISVANNAEQVAVGDIDGDGDLDVVACAARPSQFDIARNDGAGNFTVSAVSTSAVNTSASSLLLFDADGDGDLDMAYYNWNSAAPRQFEVRLNNGTGSFGAAMATTVPAQYGYATLQPGDLDQDGDLDLVLCCNGNGVDSFAQPFFNNGAGSYTAGPVYPAANYSGGAALGDVDGDGDLDLAVVDYQMASPVRLLLNNGAGVFAAGATLTSGSGAQRAAFADLDGDGDLDLLVHGVGDFVHLNDGRGGFGAAATVASSGAPRGLAVADMDNDGDLDVLAIETAVNAPLLLRRNANRTTSATRPQLTTAFRCWPNPTASTGQLWIELPTAAPATATLHDALGRLVRQQAFNGQATSLTTNGLGPGVYLLTVQAAALAPLTQRVVVE